MKNGARRHSSGLLRVIFALILAAVFVLAGASQVSQSQSDITPVSTRTRTPEATRSATLTATRALASVQQPVAPKMAQSVPGQTTVDANTIALYHFDSPAGSDAIDATGNYTGTLNGNAQVTTSGLYAGVLSLDGNGSYVRTGNLTSLSLTQGTIEAFVDYAVACGNGGVGASFPIITAGGEYGSSDPKLILGQVGDGLGFGIYENGIFHWANSGINGCRYLTGPVGALPWPYDTYRFHHVAGTWGPRGMEIWVDGILHGIANTDENSTEPYKYMCNPQTQTGTEGKPPNPSYPLCPVPHMAPPLPPGDYASGLPGYSTFLIGCDSRPPDPLDIYPYPNWSQCFKGRIDEVRISNVQRTFSAALVPTVTPTPTQTPVSLVGGYDVDAQTVALFHLNSQSGHSVLEEKTQTYKGIGFGASVVSGGRFNSGLDSTGNDSAIGTGNLGGLSAGTLEAWVDFSDATVNHPLFTARKDSTSGPMLSFKGMAQGHIRLFLAGSDISGYVDSNVLVSTLVGCWHHVAGTFGPRGMEIWLDGTLDNFNASFTDGLPYSVSGGWQVACDFWGTCSKGILDEVRVSIGQRTFTPNSPSFRPVAKSPVALGTLTFLPLVNNAPISLCKYGP